MQSKSLENKLDMIQVLESNPDACYFVNNNWEIEFINKAGEPYIKTAEPFIHKTKEELIGENIWDIVPHLIDTEIYRTSLKAFDKQTTQIIEYKSELLKCWFEVKMYPNENGLFVVLIEITDKKESEKQKQQFEKLHIIGEMAAGVAHEVRNPMTTVKGFLQLMAAENQENEKNRSRYKLMIDELNRVNDIITQFLDIANVKPENLENYSLNNVINTVLPLLETRALKEGKTIKLNLNEFPELRIDKNEIRQLLLNMINNSLDAMDSGKTVQISTFVENEKVILAIKDEGTGIPADMIDDITTPFFTTKETGTGLGIPICFSIAKRNNAEIDFTSNSEGTTFNIRFSY